MTGLEIDISKARKAIGSFAKTYALQARLSKNFADFDIGDFVPLYKEELKEIEKTIEHTKQRVLKVKIELTDLNK